MKAISMPIFNVVCSLLSFDYLHVIGAIDYASASRWCVLFVQVWSHWWCLWRDNQYPANSCLFLFWHDTCL